MASELEVTYQGDATLYAILRRHEDAQVFNVATRTFVGWADADVADYDIVLSDRDGDLYQGDWPSDINAGDYRVLYYRQEGESPAITDLLLATTDVYWNGHDIATATNIALRDDALTSLATVKRFLRLDHIADDTLIAELINQVTGKIERLCGRRFKLAVHRQWLEPGLLGMAFLAQSPVKTIRRVAGGRGAALSVRYEGSAIHAAAAVTEESVDLIQRDADGIATTTSLNFDQYGSTAAMRTAIAAVSGWSATLTRNVSSTWLIPRPGVFAMGRNVELAWPDQDEDSVRCQPAIGSLIWPEPCMVHGPVLVEYEAGFDPIPDDLRAVATELVAQAYHAGRRDPSVRRENLGDFSYTLVDAMDLTDGQRAKLLPYLHIPLAREN
ncbi:MAG: phage gp6-like head-tail connector protein [Phycisphaeraceae bacterium]|nr:phage gp6-like head-tail connector protein [Phycisphaeraceae bacterium]